MTKRERRQMDLGPFSATREKITINIYFYTVSQVDRDGPLS